MKIIQIPVKEILEDFFFSFTSNQDITLLKKSIQASGIRTPVHVWLKRNKYQLISGFSRYLVAKELQFKEIPGVLTDTTTPLEKIFRGIVLEHLVAKPLNLIEKARILSILDSVEVTEKTIHNTFVPLLELPKDPDLRHGYEQFKAHGYRRSFSHVQAWLLPIGLSLGFLALFALANPVISAWLEDTWRSISSVVEELPAAGRVVMWLVVGLGVWALLRYRSGISDHPPETKSTREPLLEDLLASRTVVRCLVLFNALFAVQTAPIGVGQEMRAGFKENLDGFDTRHRLRGMRHFY